MPITTSESLSGLAKRKKKAEDGLPVSITLGDAPPKEPPSSTSAPASASAPRWLVKAWVVTNTGKKLEFEEVFNEQPDSDAVNAVVRRAIDHWSNHLPDVVYFSNSDTQVIVNKIS